MFNKFKARNKINTIQSSFERQFEGNSQHTVPDYY
jgi:hypothetical protein